MELNGRHGIGIEQRGVLNNQHIDAGMIKIPCESPRVRHLTVKENSVKGDMNPNAESVRIGYNLLDIRKRIGGGLARTKLWRTYIYGVGPMVNRSTGAFSITGWSKELNDIARQMASGVRHKIKDYEGKGENVTVGETNPQQSP